MIPPTMFTTSRFMLPLLLFLLAGSAGTDARDVADHLQWRFVGPFRGGRVLAVAGHPTETQRFYFGSVNGGVWETRDAGRTWQPIFEGQPVGSIGAIALAPSDPDTIYVGTGEADMRSDIAQGDGMFRSTDGGRTWQNSGLADTQQIARIIVHPGDPRLVFVAALGHPYGPNAERGVYRSRDGGGSWQKVLGPDPDTGAVDVLFEPGNPRNMYAALWQTRRTPWSVYPPSNGAGSAVFRSIDGGEHWTRLADGLPQAHGRVGLAVAPSEPARVYAVVDADAGGGVYRSDDRGGHWRLVGLDPRVWQRGWYFGRLTVDPRDANRVFALNTIVLRSDDGGATWIPLKGDPTGDDFHELWIDPRSPDRRILGTDQGAIVTMNGGDTWSSWHNQPTAQFYHVATDTRFPYMVYGAQQDSGAAGVPSRSAGRNGINITNFHEVTAGGESDNVAPDPADPEIIYGGRVDRLDLRSGQTQRITPTLAYPDLHRTTWTLPLVFSPRDPRVLYFSHQHVYRTTDGGNHWARISPDLTREDPGVPSNLDPATAAVRAHVGPRQGVVYTIAPSPLVDREIWVGTDDGLVWRTRDEGGRWENVTPAALTPWSKVGAIAPSQHDPETAYIAVDRHRLDDFQPYIYRTTDGGRTWTPIAAGIAATHAVNVIREDPVRKGLLYAGTERGAYVSLDDGARWMPLQRNLPRTSVRDIEVKGVDLVIATHGRGFWILDDISVLRQAEGSAEIREPRLFTPAPATRVREQGFAGTPFPKDEPRAENPPAGAVIDYVLADGTHGPITLTIRDAAGAEVRQYSSADMPPPPDLSLVASAPEWVPQPVTLTATPGYHRFVWPIRLAATSGSTRHDAFADGVWAPPGRYTITLTVDGRPLTAPLEVRPDPRVILPASAYVEQFALAREIDVVRGQVAAITAQASTLQREISERRVQASPNAAAALDTFQRRLTDVAGVAPTANPANAFGQPMRGPLTLRYVTTLLASLTEAVDGSDHPPSADARDGFLQAKQLTVSVSSAWDRLRTDDLSALNAALRRAGAAPVQRP
jgi:photosystem II stability/assembly factor-like uncharacterized protein